MKNELEKILQANLKKFPHSSENRHYYGFSDLYNEMIFVKVFKDYKKFQLEKEVLLESDILLASYQKSKVLVLKYRPYCEIKKEDISKDILEDIAITISNFHQKRWLSIESKKEVELEKVLSKNIERLNIRKEFSRILKIYSKFIPIVKELGNEYEETLVLIHGDFGLRNIKKIHNNITLIDFERVKYASYYLDFIKFFYQDLEGNKEKKDLFLEYYYQYTKEKQISKQLEYCLIFISALGILNYTSRVKDTKFEKLGLLMLSDVEEYII